VKFNFINLNSCNLSYDSPYLVYLDLVALIWSANYLVIVAKCRNIIKQFQAITGNHEDNDKDDEVQTPPSSPVPSGSGRPSGSGGASGLGRPWASAAGTSASAAGASGSGRPSGSGLHQEPLPKKN
jgi:hypothetical protein